MCKKAKKRLLKPTGKIKDTKHTYRKSQFRVLIQMKLIRKSISHISKFITVTGYPAYLTPKENFNLDLK